VLDLVLPLLALYLPAPGPSVVQASPAAQAAPRGAVVIVSGVDRGFNWAKPFRPEPWWPIGARILGYFDHDVVLARGRDLPELVEDIEASLRARGLNSIRRIEVWTHGQPGSFRIQRQHFGREIFTTRNARLLGSLQTLRARLMGGAVIHFRSCVTFHGPEGRAFAEAASRFLNATGKGIILMGHTRPTGLIHPGWRTLLPGRRATWSDREGTLEAPLENAEILVRDLLWICTGGAAECAPYLIEHWLPALRERVEGLGAAAARAILEVANEMPGLRDSRSGSAPSWGRGR
jgi:hypothetical protein